MNLLIIIRGPLGIGKSTIAKMVANKLCGKYVSVDDILADNGLDIVDEKIGCIPEVNFLKVNKLIEPQLLQLSQEFIPIVIDGNFYYKSQIEDLIKNYPFNSLVFSLSAPLEVCLQRDQMRQKSLGQGATRAVYKLVSKFTYGQIVDVSQITAEEASKLILSKIYSQD